VTYLLYCGGNSQSIRVGTVMSQNGFTKLYRLVDGYVAWRRAGFPREK
jgi:rhodanese-related sulfurtransferase